MTRIKAVLWDVDGTVAETERDGHRVAFNQAFEACGVPWRWDEVAYGDLLRVTGGRERLMHDMNNRTDAPALAGQRDALAREIHAHKNAIYADLVKRGGIPLREGGAGAHAGVSRARCAHGRDHHHQSLERGSVVQGAPRCPMAGLVLGARVR